MKKIFEQGEFSSYRKTNLNESVGTIYKHADSLYHRKLTTVFISHKHEDLSELQDIIGFLETTYGVKAYIDSRDPEMPPITTGETAETIKKRIKDCNKFILLATNNAIESKWCNWELGYGDAQKFKEHIALFPIKPKDTYDRLYKGNEYLSIYPYITYYNGTEKYVNTNETIRKGFYVRTERPNQPGLIIPLRDWLSNI